MAPSLVRRIFALALVTQGTLIAAAWGLSAALDLPAVWGDWRVGVLAGTGGALLLAAANYLLLRHAPSNWVVDGVGAVYHEVLVPLFAAFPRYAIVVVGAAAGLGEEWLFRGVVQPLVGVVAASLVFGLAHVGGRAMLAFGVWASAMGLLLGVLALVTGGLIAPIVAHGLYDILALEYIRRGAHTA